MSEGFKPSIRELAGGRAQRPESRFRQTRIVAEDEEDSLDKLVKNASSETETKVDIGIVLVRISEFLDDDALGLLHHFVRIRSLTAIRKLIDNIGKNKPAYAAACRAINQDLLSDQSVIDWGKVQLQLGITTTPKKS